MKRHGTPKTITTDGLRAYKAAMNEIGNAENWRSGAGPTRGLSTPTNRSDDESRRCSGQITTLQTFSALRASVHNLFNQDRHLTSRDDSKARRSTTFAE